MTGDLSAPSSAVVLFGTEDEAPQPRLLRAGALTAGFEAGNLRHIRFGGVEVIRAISFIVRDRNWGTFDPVLSNIVVTEAADRFVVSYAAVATDGAQTLRYTASIEGHADGRLDFAAEAVPATPFLTNRTGFVVLHPIAGVAGEPVTVERVDGSLEPCRFPEAIDPVQPLMDLRALTHAAGGLTVTCRMEGDTFEMEDQRNWTDASYKTYVRPLALPWPYTLPAGETIRQSVRLAIAGPAPAMSAGETAVILTLGELIGPAPALGLGYDPDADAATRDHIEALRRAGAHHLICHYDPRRGHGRATLIEAADLARQLGATPWLEAVVVAIEGAEAEIAALGHLVAGIGSPFTTVLLSPAADLKCTLPGTPWPPAPPAATVFAAARTAFPDARIGGGMFSLFTELNRKRPPVDLLDLVSFTTTATVHAGDDHSIMESLEALPAIARSARSIAGAKPFAVGPSAIGMRMNPYGEAPLQNPGNKRQAMNFNDPRQRGLLGAAWAVGYVAAFARHGASAIALGGTTGPFGLVHAPHDWPQPWFDEAGGLFPIFHAVRGLAALAGLPMRAFASSAPDRVQGIAVDGEDGLVTWVANLTARTQRVTLPARPRDAFVLDAANFVAASRDPEAIETLTQRLREPAIDLAPFAIARVRYS